MKSFKDQSRIDWHNKDRQLYATEEDIKTGALQRIADATEVMAKNYIKMQSDLDLYKRLYKEVSESNSRMARRIYSLKGVITKLKKKGVNASL